MEHPIQPHDQAKVDTYNKAHIEVVKMLRDNGQEELAVRYETYLPITTYEGMNRLTQFMNGIRAILKALEA